MSGGQIRIRSIKVGDLIRTKMGRYGRVVTRFTSGEGYGFIVSPSNGEALELLAVWETMVEVVLTELEAYK